MQRDGMWVTCEERVRQSVGRIASIFDVANYVPVEQAQPKLWRWQAHGAEISYLGSSRKSKNMFKNVRLLRPIGFPPGTLYHRGPDETCAQIVERLSPDVLIEDDCESIGGEAEMAMPHLSAEARADIKTIVVPEFGGTDHLPDDPALLLAWGGAREVAEHAR